MLCRCRKISVIKEEVQQEEHPAVPSGSESEGMEKAVESSVTYRFQVIKEGIALFLFLLLLSVMYCLILLFFCQNDVVI